MNTVKILHCADLHIGANVSFLGEKAEGRRREILLTFENIVDLCVTERVDVLLIAGDLFDSSNIESSFAEAVFNKIKSVPQLKVVYTAGNHDPFNPRSPLANKSCDNLYIFGSEESVIKFPELNLNIYGQSFETAFLKGKEKPDLVGEEGTINISLLHGELGGDINSRYNAISREYIEGSRMDYIALGHIHKGTNVAEIGGTRFAYSGCPEGQGFDELGEKGVLMGEIGKGICSLKFIPTAKRLHISEKIDITGCDNIPELIINTLTEKYGENYSQNLYKIKLTGSVAEDFSINLADVTARVEDKVYFAKIKDKTQLSIDLIALSKEKSLKGIFVKKMLEKIENAEDKQPLSDALNMGLKAFSGEVKFNDN